MVSSKNSRVDDIEEVEDEWSRTMTNPDNVILSDSLVGLLDPEDLTSEIVNSPQTSLTCAFEFEDYAIGGTLASYSDADGIRTYAFFAQPLSLHQIVNRSRLVSGAITQTGVQDPVIIEVDPKANVGVSVHIQDGNSAMVTVSFSDSAT